MRNENTTNQPQLLIQGGGKTYELRHVELSEFLNIIQTTLNISDQRDLAMQMQDIMDLVIDGIPDDGGAGRFKRNLQLLREIDLLFKGFLIQR